MQGNPHFLTDFEYVHFDLYSGGGFKLCDSWEDSLVMPIVNKYVSDYFIAKNLANHFLCAISVHERTTVCFITSIATDIRLSSLRFVYAYGRVTDLFSRHIAWHVRHSVVQVYESNQRGRKVSCCPHPLLNNFFVKPCLHFIPMMALARCLAEYFCVNILTVAIGTASGLLLHKICDSLFSFLSSGRK